MVLTQFQIAILESKKVATKNTLLMENSHSIQQLIRWYHKPVILKFWVNTRLSSAVLCDKAPIYRKFNFESFVSVTSEQWKPHNMSQKSNVVSQVKKKTKVQFAFINIWKCCINWSQCDW